MMGAMEIMAIVSLLGRVAPIVLPEFVKLVKTWEGIDSGIIESLEEFEADIKKSMAIPKDWNAPLS